MASPTPTGHPRLMGGGGGLCQLMGEGMLGGGGGGFVPVAMATGGGCHSDGAGDKAMLELMGGEWERESLPPPLPPPPVLGVLGMCGALGAMPGTNWASHRGPLRAEHPGGPLRPGGLPQRGHLPQPAGGGVPLPVPPRALRETLLHHEHPQLPPALLPHLPRPPPALPLHPRPDVSPREGGRGVMGDPRASDRAWGDGVWGGG